jgi:hypothetical protein
MPIRDAIKPKTPVSYQVGGPRDVLKGLGESFHRSRAAKREDQTPASLYQPTIFYTRHIRRFLRKPMAITLPFYSDSVFLKEEDALAFIPYFLRRLVDKGLVPATVIGENGMVDEKAIEAGLANLTMAFAERSDL